MDNYRMLLVVYRDQEGARRMREYLQEMDDNDIVDIESAAVIVKDVDGSVDVDDENDVEAGGGALAGAIAGGLIGLLAGPGGAIVGAVTGAATGGVSASMIDMGFDDDVIDQIKADMQPNSSALIAVVDEDWSDRFETSIADKLDNTVSHYYHDVKSEVIEQWRRAKAKFQ